MTRRGLGAVLAVLAACGPTSAFVLGGGNPEKDCSVVFAGVDQDVGASGVVCRPGDPACAGGGRSCAFAVSLCTHATVRGCGAVDLASIAVAGAAVPPPPLPSATPGCGEPLTITVPEGRTRGVTLLAQTGFGLGDVDYLNLCCVESRTPYAAALCALAVDLRDSGCREGMIPRALGAGLKRAHALAAQAARSPRRARKLAARADKLVAGLMGISRKVAKQDPCGNTLGLMLKHARFALASAIRSRRP